MDVTKFVETCFSNPFKIKEIKSTIDASIDVVNTWCENNRTICANVSAAKVSSTLIQMFNKLTSSGVPVDIAAICYSKYAVIAIIMANQKQLVSSKSTYNKIMKLYYQILGNSKHFTMVYKKSAMKHARSIKVAPKMPVELFWMIPLFTNPSVFVQFDFNAFKSMIETYTEIQRLIPDFVSSFDKIVMGISIETTTSFREYMAEIFQEIKAIEPVTETV